MSAFHFDIDILDNKWSFSSSRNIPCSCILSKVPFPQIRLTKNPKRGFTLQFWLFSPSGFWIRVTAHSSYLTREHDKKGVVHVPSYRVLWMMTVSDICIHDTTKTWISEIWLHPCHVWNSGAFEGSYAHLMDVVTVLKSGYAGPWAWFIMTIPLNSINGASADHQLWHGN